MPADATERFKLETRTPIFKVYINNVVPNETLCVRSKLVSTILKIDHRLSLLGQVKLVKTVSGLCNIFWSHKLQDVKSQADWCWKCQQLNDYSPGTLKKSWEPYRWMERSFRWFALDFIIGFPRSVEVFDAVWTRVDNVAKNGFY